MCTPVTLSRLELQNKSTEKKKTEKDQTGQDGSFETKKNCKNRCSNMSKLFARLHKYVFNNTKSHKQEQE